MAKKVTSIKFKKELNLVKTIVEEYFDKEVISYFDDNCEKCTKECDEQESTTVIFPMGNINYDGKDWVISYDITFIKDNPSFITGVSCMVSDFWDNGIKLQTMEPHHAIFNKDDICVGCIFESEVIDNAADHDLDYDESLKILSKELIKDYIKESKKSKEVVH